MPARLECCIGICFSLDSGAGGCLGDCFSELWGLGIVSLWCPVLGVALVVVLGFVFPASADLGVILGVALLTTPKSKLSHELIDQRPQCIYIYIYIEREREREKTS